MKKNRKLFISILILFCFIFPFIQTSDDIFEITLKSKEKEKEVELSEEDSSKIIYIKGDIDKDKKYLLISLINNELKPSIYVSKNKDYDLTIPEYDYTLLSKENKLVLPSSYFKTDELNGFYMFISWDKEFKDLTLKFECLDEITLDIGEEFSFYARNENVDKFKIKVNNKSEKLKLRKLRTTIGNIGFILSGGDEKQLSMTVDKNKAKQMLNNIFAYWVEDVEDDYSVNINVSKNVKFLFKTQIFNAEDEEIEEKDLEENLNNQIFLVKNNRQECFNFKFDDENERDLIILSQEKFLLNIKGDTEANYEYNIQNNVKYAISDNLKLDKSNKNFCITLNKEDSDDISLIQIYLFNKLNNEEIIQEPLISGIKYSYILSKKHAKSSTNQNINIHTHSQFFDKFSEKGDILGTNAIIKILSGKIKLYTDICTTYPKCNYNNNSRFKKEIYQINDYFHTLIKATSDTYLTSKKQNLFIVICEDETHDCKYEILFNNNQEKIFIKSLDTITKFLEPYTNIENNKMQDTYYTYLHNVKNKIVINLAVFSGDAYIVQNNDVKGCRFDEEHFGSDERRIFHCDEDNLDDTYDINNNFEIKIEFSIRAGKEGAIYSLFILEQALDVNNIYLPIDISKFETVTNYKNKFRFITTKKEVDKTITYIYPINCNMNITNDKKKYYSNENNYLEYTNNFRNKSYFDLFFGKYNNYNNIDKCLFYFSSYSYSNEDSYLTITENKPLKFRLNNNLTNIKSQYLYAMTNGIKKIYLKVNVIGNNALKIKIENINEENTNEYIVKDNKIITIMNGNNSEDINSTSLNNILKLKIYVELYQKTLKKGEKKEAFVELKIITDLNNPYFLKNGEQLSDVLINDEYKYYVALINKGSSGNYYINLNNGNNGYIYGRLLDSDHIKENGGWNNRFVLPNSNTDKNKLLPFDFENQKLIIEKEHTNFCNKFCYLLMGIKLNSINLNLDFTKTIVTGLNSYLKLNDNKDDSTDDKKKFIKLTNNEYISSYVTDDESDFFSYKLNEHNSKLNMTFTCDNCIMTIVFNNTNFNKDPQKYISNGDKQIINLGDNKNIKNATAYIKINTINNETNSTNKNNRDTKYRYSFKLNSPNDINDTFNYLDGSMPETIEFKNKKYIDYAIKLDTYNSEEDINIIAVPNIDIEDNNIGMNKDLKNDIEIYAKVVNDDENITMDSWPTREKHDFPVKGQNSSNFLKIKKEDIKKGKNGKGDKIMLVRIYGKENDNINLHTNYEDIDNKVEEDLLIPGKYQLITVNNSNSNSSFKINIPPNLDKNKEYIYKIKKLDGNGKVSYGDETFELNDKYDSISIPLDKNIPPNKNKIDIKSLNINKNKNNTSNESFTFLIKYEEKNDNNNLEKMKIGGSKYFSWKDDTKPIENFIPLENINDDLPININFDDILSNQEDEYKDQIRNNTETFDLEGFLITEEELNEIKNGNLSVIDKKKDYKYKGNYYLENRHGFLNINKNEIERFKKKNKNSKPYLYFRMKKSKTNDKKYDNIKGNINIYPPSNNTQIPIPENDYNFNSIDCSKKNNYHIYKLGDKTKNKNEGISSKTHNMAIDFISPIEGLKVKIVKGLNEKEQNDTYFNITKKENDNGKDTITISEHIDDAYLLVEIPDETLNKTDDINTNVDYMFKYSYEKKDKGKDGKNIPDIKYNNTITYTKMGNTDLKTNLTLNKIKDSKTNKAIPCNYYIRVYKNNTKKKSKNNINNYKEKDISLINNNHDNDLYALYKIDSNNPLLQNETEDTFTVPIEIDTEEPVFFDVVAESVPDKNKYGYSKGYPNTDDDKGGDDQNKNGERSDDGKEDPNPKKDGGGFSLIKFILIFICGLLLLILLIVCCIKTCTCSCLSRKGKDEQPSTLLPGLRDITFHTTDDEGENNFTASSLY